MKDSPRKEILNKIARAIGKIELAHPVRVGIDGLSASGKTVFADELASVLQDEGKIVVRTGLDGFHNPPEIRHRQGPHVGRGLRRGFIRLHGSQGKSFATQDRVATGGMRRKFSTIPGEPDRSNSRRPPRRRFFSSGRDAIPQRTHRVFRFQDFGRMFAPSDSRAGKSSRPCPSET